MTQVLRGIVQNATGSNPNGVTQTPSPQGNVETWQVISYNGRVVTAKRGGKKIDFEKIRRQRGLTNPNARSFAAIQSAVKRGFELGRKRAA